MSNYKEDKKFSEEKECQVIMSILERNMNSGIICGFKTSSDLGLFYDWDIKLLNRKAESVCTLEVKSERISTSNLFIEVAYDGRSSGLLMSKADYYVYLAGEEPHMYIMKRETLINELRKFGNTCIPAKENDYAVWCENLEECKVRCKQHHALLSINKDGKLTFGYLINKDEAQIKGLILEKYTLVEDYPLVLPVGYFLNQNDPQASIKELYQASEKNS